MKHYKFLKSSNLDKAAYDPDTHELTIQFLSGAAYCYKSVGIKVFYELCNADENDESPGKYFSSEIKNNYECFKLELSP